MQPRNGKFLTLFSKAGSNVVESGANLMEFAAAPHERLAKLAKRMRRPASSGSMIGASPGWPGVSRITSGRPGRRPRRGSSCPARRATCRER